jgi:ubiquinone/menaquinone biosynthesis C-methylase UbiE
MQTLKLLPIEEYVGVDQNDPIRFYSTPIIGELYRRRVEMCLDQLPGGESVLEVGFGSGLTFLNLSEKYVAIYGIDLTADPQAVSAVFERRGIKTELSAGNVVALPYPDNYFDSVLLISILEHLQPSDLKTAFAEIHRVLKPGGQLVYGVPCEKPFMVLMFRLLGYNIREHHFSTEHDVASSASTVFSIGQVVSMKAFGLLEVYQIGVFTK